MNGEKPLSKVDRVPLVYSGLFLFLSGFTIFMGIISAEMLYTLDFDTRDHYISELAAALPEGAITPQPSGLIFNISLIISGILIVFSSIIVHGWFRKLLFTIPLLLFGMGLTGVGIFPGNVFPWHGIFANLLFLAGGLGAITSFKIVNSPLRYVFILFGIISLTLLFSHKYIAPFMGIGGAERWVFYPLVFWVTGLGAYLSGQKKRV